MHDDKTTNITSIMTPLPLDTSGLGDSVHSIISIMKDKHRGSVVIFITPCASAYITGSASAASLNLRIKINQGKPFYYYLTNTLIG